MSCDNYRELTQVLFDKVSCDDKENILIYEEGEMFSNIREFARSFVGSGLVLNQRIVVVTAEPQMWSKIPKVQISSKSKKYDLTKEVDNNSAIQVINSSDKTEEQILLEVQETYEYGLESPEDDSLFRILIDDSKLMTNGFLYDLRYFSRRSSSTILFVASSNEDKDFKPLIGYFDKTFELNSIDENIEKTEGLIKITRYANFANPSLCENYGVGLQKALFWGFDSNNLIYFRDIDFTEVV